MKCNLYIAILIGLVCMSTQSKLPDHFVYVKRIIPDIDVELRYFSSNNFVGDTIVGYHDDILILTFQAATALKRVQEQLYESNLCLRIYDGYRPQSAVNHFIRWARKLDDTLMKQKYYPLVDKRNLFKDGYIATKSGHSRGSTVDLTLVDGASGQILDMGSPYDFFGVSSWVAHNELTQDQKENRLLLQQVMLKNGFRNYDKEWWHFTLRNEPFPDTYFDFEIN